MRDRVVAAAKEAESGRRKTWHSKLSKPQLEELLAIKVALLAGDLDVSARSLAAAIIADLDRQGTRVCSAHTLSLWLNAK